MSGEDAIKIEGVVVAALSNRLYRVELPNGHRLLGHLPRLRKEAGKRQDASSFAFAVGQRVTVEMSAFDFSKGRICLKKE